MHFYTTLSYQQQNLRRLCSPKKRDGSCATGRAMSLSEMLHSILKYSVVSTDLQYICIPTTPLELRQSHNILLSNNNDIINIEDGSEIGNFCNNARKSLNLPEWRHFTPNQINVVRK